MIKRFYKSLTPYISHPISLIIFALLFFIEAIFFVPVDPILIMFCLERPPRAYMYALVATVASVFGGITAYLIGAALFDSIGIKIIEYFSSIETFDKITYLYRTYETSAVLISSFTPFPYKIVTLSAGFCRLPILPFIFFSVLGRGMRFFLVAFLIRRYGPQVQQFINRYFNYLVIIFTLLIILCMVILK